MKPMPQANPRSSPRLVGLIVGFLVALALPASAATVATDKADYAPGETVVITGSGWEPGERIVLVLRAWTLEAKGRNRLELKVEGGTTTAKATTPHETKSPARGVREDREAGRC